MNNKLKIIHTGDLHLGMENYGRQDSKTLINTRIQDFLKSFDYIVDYAIDNKVDVFIIAGDIYHQKEPSIYIQNEFSKRLSRLKGAGIYTILLIGNHDSISSLSRISSLQIFHELKVPYIYVFEKAGLIKLETNNGPVQIVGLPYIEKNSLKEHMLNKGIAEEEQQSYFDDLFGKLLDGFEKEMDPEIPSILTAHLTLREAIYENWKPAIIGNELYISKSILSRGIFSYVALGHIHKNQFFTNESSMPQVAYCGSIDTLDFGEANFEHGFIYIELSKDSFDSKFIKIPDQRNFRTIELNVSDNPHTIEELKSRITKNNKDDIIRLNLTQDEQSPIDEQEIRREISGECFILSTIKIDKKKRKLTRINDLTSEIHPSEAIKKYIDCSDDEYLKENRDELIRITEELLKEIKNQ